MVDDRPELGPRKSAVLRAVVEEYVRTGEPVGSETIAEAAGLGVSSATIRNEMAALEELGYLTHPHTSAGRIPTDVGYRHYVDSLPAGGRLREAQRRAIAGYFAEAIVDLEEVLKGSVQLLSRLTQYAGLAVPPSASEEPIVRLELIDMGPTVMILAVGQHGRVDKRVIDRPEAWTTQDARATPSDGCRRCAGSPTWRRRRGCCSSPPRARASEHDLLLNVAETLRAAQPRGSGRARRGGRRVEPGRRGAADAPRDPPPALRDARTRAGDAARAAGRELRRRRARRHDRRPSTRSTGEWEASIITAPFKAGDTTLGTIGVVGPTRMDYLSAMASVRAVAQAAVRAGHGARRSSAWLPVRDLYEVLGRRTRRLRTTTSSGLPQARARAPPRRERRRREAEERFKEVAGAYEILSDPEKRQRYDAFGQTGGPQGARFSDIQDIFDMFFGGRVRRAAAAGRRAGRAAARSAVRTCGVPISLTFTRGGVRRAPGAASSNAWSCASACMGNGAEPGTAPVACRTCRREPARSSRCAGASSAR